MAGQYKNPQLISIQGSNFGIRGEPNVSWVSYIGAVEHLCALRGHWPMGSQTRTAAGTFARDIACGFGLQYLPAGNPPQAGYMESATQTALPPWILFVAANSQYLSYTADNPQHDIIGTETSVYANERGLGVCGWFRFASVGAVIMGLISKWEQTIGNQRAYRLYKNAADNIVFEISANGAAVTAVTSSGTVTTGKWYRLLGRFDPSTSLDVWVDNVKTSNVALIPAAIFNSTEPLEIGRTDRANYLDGQVSNAFLTASQQTDSISLALWEHSRIMYNRDG